jgi:hypothetical protein
MSQQAIQSIFKANERMLGVSMAGFGAEVGSEMGGGKITFSLWFVTSALGAERFAFNRARF